MELTLSSWVPNRDAQTGIMNLLLKGGPPGDEVAAFPVDDNADPRRVETVDEARPSETFQDCNNY